MSKFRSSTKSWSCLYVIYFPLLFHSENNIKNILVLLDIFLDSGIKLFFFQECGHYIVITFWRFYVKIWKCQFLQIWFPWNFSSWAVLTHTLTHTPTPHIHTHTNTQKKKRKKRRKEKEKINLNVHVTC